MNGEGVFGLRRSFQLAGAETVVMSMWQVSDKYACDFMRDFYSYYLSGMDKSGAIRQATMDALNRGRECGEYFHPFYRGAFALIGDPN